MRADDIVTYQVDVKASNDDVKNVQVWDRLPAAFDCTDVSAISDGGTCVDGGSGRDVIKWTIPAIAEDATKSLTYKVEIPSDVGPENNYVNESGVREYQADTNTGGTYTYTPENNIDPDNPNTPNIARVDDPSNVRTPNVAISKARTTSISEDRQQRQYPGDDRRDHQLHGHHDPAGRHDDEDQPANRRHPRLGHHAADRWYPDRAAERQPPAGRLEQSRPRARP